MEVSDFLQVPQNFCREIFTECGDSVAKRKKKFEEITREIQTNYGKRKI